MNCPHFTDGTTCTVCQEFSELRHCVGDMRNKQKEYFRTRSGQALADSKRAEKHVDKLLTRLAGKQKELF